MIDVRWDADVLTTYLGRDPSSPAMLTQLLERKRTASRPDLCKSHTDSGAAGDGGDGGGVKEVGGGVRGITVVYIFQDVTLKGNKDGGHGRRRSVLG